MTISKDLFLAILSLDAYNLGYDAGIGDSSGNDPDGLGGVGSQIGNATVTQESDVAEETAGVSQGFYGLAYTLNADVGNSGDILSSGTTIISYRGTDNANPCSSLAADRTGP